MRHLQILSFDHHPATFLTYCGIKVHSGHSIITLNDFELVLPEESVAVQTTSVCAYCQIQSLMLGYR